MSGIPPYPHWRSAFTSVSATNNFGITASVQDPDRHRASSTWPSRAPITLVDVASLAGPTTTLVAGASAFFAVKSVDASSLPFVLVPSSTAVEPPSLGTAVVVPGGVKFTARGTGVGEVRACHHGFCGSHAVKVTNGDIDRLVLLDEYGMPFDGTRTLVEGRRYPFDVRGEDVEAIYRDGSVPLRPEWGGHYHANQFVMLRDHDTPTRTALGRFDAKERKITQVRKMRDPVWGIRPRNREQHYALDLLLNDDIKLVTLVGKAGTGKTLLAIAAGLQKTVEESVYHKLLVSRPIFPLGRDIGFLPGGIEEKLNPWMQPIFDNVELLLGFSKAEKKAGRTYHELIDLGYIQIEPLTYIRGRSIPNQYMIVDEAQNLTPHEVKTIITRVGDNTKIVLTGDPYQIDNPYVDSVNNGLTTVVERFKGEPVAGHVTLSKGERSQLAELAANVL